MSALSVNGFTIGFYPDEGDAGGTKSYLSDLNDALTTSWPHHPHHKHHHHATSAPSINVVGWYAQTYPGELFTGFQLMPLVDNIKREYERCQSSVPFIYEASVMPFQAWSGYTPTDNSKAIEVAQVMCAMLDRSKLPSGQFTISEIRLRFGHEMNYYIGSGLYPPSTSSSDPGLNFRTAFDTVALAVRCLPSAYKDRIKLFWCPNIASTSSSSGAIAEYQTYLPTLEYIDYVGIDYYCPAPGSLSASDFVRKMRIVHDKWASPSRPFILGETGLHFDAEEGGNIEAKLRWLEAVTGKEARKGLPNMIGLSWFNYEKDRDYRLLWVGEGEGETRHNGPFVQWLMARLDKKRKVKEEKKAKAKFWKTLFSN
ncbi:uncharacterized protein UTRI_05728 [Ustilago trichophora]|uniref:GH26 domain-containing protein n=1 Tax=Ustilago trichophora TaxID=86804 RepID=A0A5C3EHX0_9BASI|nr:uncharacterized protein UTRI_05728 [Ustilago trichophora]